MFYIGCAWFILREGVPKQESPLRALFFQSPLALSGLIVFPYIYSPLAPNLEKRRPWSRLVYEPVPRSHHARL